VEHAVNAPPTSLVALFHGAERGFTLTRVPLPSLREGEALVRVEATTLCGSDLHSVHGRRSVPLPTILGHEVVGHVVDVLGEVQTLAGAQLERGDRVVWSVVIACGVCARCARGLQQKCLALTKFGHSAQEDGRPRLDGGLSEYVILPRGAAIQRVHASIPAPVAALASCAAATAAACLRVAGGAPGLEGARVLVLGGGALGLFATLFARRLGASEVQVVDVAPARLELALALGATATHTLVDPDSERAPALLAVELERGFDVVLEVSGRASACERAFAAAGVGGRVILAGAVSPIGLARLDPERLVRRLVRIEGVHNYTPADLAAALRWIGSHEAPWPEALCRPARFALDAVPAAFAHAEAARPLRVAVVPN